MGVPVNKKSLVNPLKLAADSGVADAHCSHGVALAHGVNLPGDKEIAAHYYKLAADNGNHEAQLGYALCLETDNDVPVSKEAAAYDDKLAGENGSPFQDVYSHYLHLGSGTPFIPV